MILARRIWCAKCRAVVLWVKERNAESSWLFDKAIISGIAIMGSGETILCPNCKNSISSMNMDKFDKFQKDKPLEISSETDLPLYRH